MRDLIPADGLNTTSEALDAEPSIILLDTFAKLRTRDSAWLALCEHPEAHPATFEAVCAANPELIRPYVIFLLRGETIIAMAVARIQFENIPIRFGLATPASPRLRVVRVSYRGMAGSTDPDNVAALLAQLSVPLASGEADAIAFDHLKTDDPLQIWAERPSKPLRGDRAPRQQSVHWVADLSCDFPHFLAGLNKRERARNSKNNKKVERELGSRMRIACYRAPEDFATVEADTTRIAALTYQSAFGASFADQNWAGPLFRSGLETGIAHCFVLYVDHEPKAFVHGLVWRGTFYSCFMGYDPDLGTVGIGRYLNFHVIEKFCTDPTIHAWDFGFGHAEYKRRVSSTQWSEADRVVFAHRLKPRAVNRIRGIVGHFALWSDATLDALGVRDRIKQLWHRRITSRKSRPEPADGDA